MYITIVSTVTLQKIIENPATEFKLDLIDELSMLHVY